MAGILGVGAFPKPVRSEFGPRVDFVQGQRNSMDRQSIHVAQGSAGACVGFSVIERWRIMPRAVVLASEL